MGLDESNASSQGGAALISVRTNTAWPSKDAAWPSKDAAWPSKDAAWPSKDAAWPSKDTARPSKDAAWPSKDTARPSKDAAWPSKDAARPSKDSAWPGARIHGGRSFIPVRLGLYLATVTWMHRSQKIQKKGNGLFRYRRRTRVVNNDALHFQRLVAGSMGSSFWRRELGAPRHPAPGRLIHNQQISLAVTCRASGRRREAPAGKRKRKRKETQSMWFTGNTESEEFIQLFFSAVDTCIQWIQWKSNCQKVVLIKYPKTVGGYLNLI